MPPVTHTPRVRGGSKVCHPCCCSCKKCRLWPLALLGLPQYQLPPSCPQAPSHPQAWFSCHPPLCTPPVEPLLAPLVQATLGTPHRAASGCQSSSERRAGREQTEPWLLHTWGGCLWRAQGGLSWPSGNLISPKTSCLKAEVTF